jgi:NADH-quinone oxidoreductase subunit E
MSFTVPAKNFEAEVDELITHYPVKRAASLMVLHAIQEKFGWISQEAVEWTAKKLELQPINVFEILTFYPMLRQEPMGKYQIKVCRTLSCALGGAYELHKHFCDEIRFGRAQARGRRRRRTESSRWNLSSAWRAAAPRR